MPTPVAARFAAWALKRSSAGAAPAGGRGGRAFLTAQFPDGLVWVEAAFGADLAGSPDAWPWVDITADVMYAARLRMRVGRADDTSQAQSASAQFDLLNNSADYSAYNPSSSRYPNVRRNTPIRVRVDLGSGPSVVWQGYAVGWTPSWDTSGRRAIVTVVAAGILRRLGQGNSPLQSPLSRTIASSSPTFWWALEDASGSTRGASGVPGGPPLVTNSDGPVTFGTVTGPGGTTALPDFSGGAVLVAHISTSATSYRTEFAIKCPAVASPNFAIGLQIQPIPGTGNPIEIWEFGVKAPTDGGAFLEWTADNGGTADIRTTGVTLDDDEWHHVRIDFSRSAGNYKAVVTIDGTSALTWTTARDYTPPRRVGIAGDGGVGGATISSFGELAIWAPWSGTADTYSAFTGHDRETATNRLARLCSENGVALSLVGTSDQTMGPQPVSTLLTALRECEAADGGVLYDGFGPGIHYVSRTACYNRTAAVTIDVSAGQLSPPFAPVDDDQRIRNDVTVSRTGGSSARVVDTDGPLGTATVGTYDTSVSVNVDTDEVLTNMAAWQVRLGTALGLRYPNLPLDFAAVPALAQSWINNSGPSFRTDVTNVDARATQHPPDDVPLVVEGWSMNLDQVGWDVTASCSQFAPWQVGVLEDATYGILGPTDCTLHADWDGVTTGAVVTIDTATGPLWSTSGADYPRDVNLGGQRATASACSGASNPQTLTISAASVNGVSVRHYAGDAVEPWSTFVLAL